MSWEIVESPNGGKEREEENFLDHLGTLYEKIEGVERKESI